MNHLSMHSTQRIDHATGMTPFRVVALAVLMSIAIGGSGLLYCYLTTPVPLPLGDTMIFPRLPMHPF